MRVLKGEVKDSLITHTKINIWASSIKLKVSKKKIEGKQTRIRGRFDRAGDSDVISERDSWFIALEKRDWQNRKGYDYLKVPPLPSPVSEKRHKMKKLIHIWTLKKKSASCKLFPW